MNNSNASSIQIVDPVKDSSSKYTGKTSGGGCGGVDKTTTDAEATLNRFKQILKEENVASRAGKRLLEEAIQIIENLWKLKYHPPNDSNYCNADRTPTMTKILQEIQSIKVTISQSQDLARKQGQSWAKVASKAETTGTIIRIQDESEKQEIAKLSSEELVKKIGMKEVIGARQMSNGQVKVYFTGDETQKIMESQKEWTHKIAPTAHMATPNYQVLIHDMPFTFAPENPEHIKELEQNNILYIQGITIRKAAWLKRTKSPGKKTGSLIVWFDRAEQADIAISKGIMWKYELKATEIFRSGFRVMQCFNCQKYGHIAKACSTGSKCGGCAGDHNTRACPGKQEVRCCNCGRRHEAWNQICPVRIAAKAKAVANRTYDAGRYTIPESQVIDQENGWKIVDSRKRRAGTSIIEIANPVGESTLRRRPGRPRKTSSINFPEISATLTKITSEKPSTLLTQKDNESRTVTRDNQAEVNGAPECEMES